MEFYKHLIIFLASIIGFLLAFLGVKELKLKKSLKGNLFIITILSVLVFNSCVNGQNLNTDKSFTIEQSDRLKQLNNSVEWQEFKAFWQELDNIAPTAFFNYDNDEIINNFSYNYPNDTNNVSKANKLTEELENHIKDLKKINLISEEELFSLQLICKERINYLFNKKPLLLLHIRPPKINNNLYNSLNNIELKIDTLINYSNEKIISEEEYLLALDNINKEIQNVLIISSILSNYGEYMFVGSYLDTNSAKVNKQYFEEYFSNLITKQGQNSEAKKIYENINDQLAVVEDSFTKFDELINDLIVNKTSRILEFKKTNAYKSFKKYWYRIDTISPQNGKYDVYNLKKFSRIGDVKDELKIKISQIKKTDLFSSTEIDLLERLTLDRLNKLQGPNMYTRALMPITYTPEAVFELEHKIDALLKLKNNQKIDEQEYEKSLTEIFNISNKILMISLINSNFFFNKIPEDNFDKTQTNVNAYIEILQKHLDKVVAENKENKNLVNQLKKNYRNTVNRLLEINSAFITIHKLIESFEE